MSLVELIVERGEEATEALPDSIRSNPEAMAETIENNVRKLILDEMPVNPRYYEKMSELLDALIEQRRQQALEYKEYLEKIVKLTRQARNPTGSPDYPPSINNGARRALYDHLKDVEALEDRVSAQSSVQDCPDPVEAVALAVDDEIRRVKKAGWRGNPFKEREVRFAIESVLGDEDQLVEALFELAKNQREY
jgi:type I restriction enzyme R subunit